MRKFEEMTPAELQEAYESTKAQFENWKAQGLKLNMARGKPGSDQLDLVNGLLDVLKSDSDFIADGMDVRNYGELFGLPCARAYFADVLGCKPSQVLVGGNASLQLMYDTVSKAMTHGLPDSDKPWAQESDLKWLCPVPGYDRHFKITETFGFKMISIPMNENGPDMDVVEAYLEDPTVKGMWCVPKYSNPSGITYSDETIRRIANMKPAAKDFLLMWDNAYCIHEFEGEFVEFPDIISLCAEAGRPNMVVEFASTSKVTFPGAGISCMACNESMMKYLTDLMGVQAIGFDKVNQLRHVRFLKDKATTLELMKKHAAVLKPKFDTVCRYLEEQISPLGIATFNRPKGGYFVSVDTAPNLAKRTLALAKEAGVVMTSAGATYPLGLDAIDSNIRIAPSYPPLAELEQAMEVFCTCLKLAALEQKLAQ